MFRRIFFSLLPFLLFVALPAQAHQKPSLLAKCREIIGDWIQSEQAKLEEPMLEANAFIRLTRVVPALSDQLREEMKLYRHFGTASYFELAGSTRERIRTMASLREGELISAQGSGPRTQGNNLFVGYVVHSPRLPQETALLVTPTLAAEAYGVPEITRDFLLEIDWSHIETVGQHRTLDFTQWRGQPYRRSPEVLEQFRTYRSKWMDVTGFDLKPIQHAQRPVDRSPWLEDRDHGSFQSVPPNEIWRIQLSHDASRLFVIRNEKTYRLSRLARKLPKPDPRVEIYAFESGRLLGVLRYSPENPIVEVTRTNDNADDIEVRLKDGSLRLFRRHEIWKPAFFDRTFRQK